MTPSEINAASLANAKALLSSGRVYTFPVGTLRGLLNIHAALYSGLHPFAGTLRKDLVAKGGFVYPNPMVLPSLLATIEKMPETDFPAIAAKYIQVELAHPFLAGNGPASRLWLDMMLRRRLGQMTDWTRIPNNDYLAALDLLPADPAPLLSLLSPARTTALDDLPLLLSALSRSYFYEGLSAPPAD